MLGFDIDMEQFYIAQPLIVIVATFIFPLGMHLCSFINPQM